MTFGHGVFDHMAAEAMEGRSGNDDPPSLNRVGFQFNREKCKAEYLVRFGNPKTTQDYKITSSLDKALYYAQSTQYSTNPRVEINSWWSNDREKIQSIYEDGKWKGTSMAIKGRLSYGYYIVNQGKGKCSLMHDSTDFPHKPEDIAEPEDRVTHDDGKGQNEDWQEERCTPKPPTWSSFSAWSECKKGRFSNFTKADNEKDAGWMERVRTMVNPGKSCPGAYIAQEDIKTHEMKACCPDPNSTPTWSGSGMSDDLESQGYGPGGKHPRCKCKTGYEMNDEGDCVKPPSDADFCGDANAIKVAVSHGFDCVCKDGYVRAMSDDEWKTNNTGPNSSTCIKKQEEKEEEQEETTTTTPTTTVTTQSSTTTPVVSEKKGDGKGLLALALVGGLGVFAYQRRKRGK